MVQLGYSVRFVMAQQLVNAVVTTATRAELARFIKPLVTCDLLILDEFGYLTLDSQGRAGPLRDHRRAL